MKNLLALIGLLIVGCAHQDPKLEELSSFIKPAENPILKADSTLMFFDSLKNENVKWQKADVFNPAAIVKDGKVYMFTRSEDNPAAAIGGRTSRIGIAVSKDGIHFKNFPELQHEYTYRWIESENIWLQRVAIIHQLFYKETTEEKLLFDMIRHRADSKEFFIRKACGWALRQYAKTNPKSVERFLTKTKVSNLTVREARKQLDK